MSIANERDFLRILEALIVEAETNNASNDDDAENYWGHRASTLRECRQLWRETMGG